MKRITYTCDKCEKEIEDVVYTLTSYAEDVSPSLVSKMFNEIALLNGRQNRARQLQERHLCKECKDAITDGVFIL
jgi:hypothetical protein